MAGIGQDRLHRRRSDPVQFGQRLGASAGTLSGGGVGCGDEVLDGLEMPGQGRGGCLPDVTDAQAEDESV